MSTRVRTLSSRKNGLPSVRTIRSCLSGARLGSSPRRACRSSSALTGAGGRAGAGRYRSAPPAVLVLRPIVAQQQQPGRGQALDQPSRNACVSESIQCRSSKTRSRGWTCSRAEAPASGRRACAAPLRRSRVRNGLSFLQGIQRARRAGLVSSRRRRVSAPVPSLWPGWCGCRRGPPPGHSASAGRAPGK